MLGEVLLRVFRVLLLHLLRGLYGKLRPGVLYRVLGQVQELLYPKLRPGVFRRVQGQRLRVLPEAVHLYRLLVYRRV